MDETEKSLDCTSILHLKGALNLWLGKSKNSFARGVKYVWLQNSTSHHFVVRNKDILEKGKCWIFLNIYFQEIRQYRNWIALLCMLCIVIANNICTFAVM